MRDNLKQNILFNYASVVLEKNIGPERVIAELFDVIGNRIRYQERDKELGIKSGEYNDIDGYKNENILKNVLVGRIRDALVKKGNRR